MIKLVRLPNEQTIQDAVIATATCPAAYRTMTHDKHSPVDPMITPYQDLRCDGVLEEGTEVLNDRRVAYMCILDIRIPLEAYWSCTSTVQSSEDYKAIWEKAYKQETCAAVSMKNMENI